MYKREKNSTFIPNDIPQKNMNVNYIYNYNPNNFYAIDKNQKFLNKNNFFGKIADYKGMKQYKQPENNFEVVKNEKEKSLELKNKFFNQEKSIIYNNEKIKKFDELKSKEFFNIIENDRLKKNLTKNITKKQNENLNININDEEFKKEEKKFDLNLNLNFKDNFNLLQENFKNREISKEKIDEIEKINEKIKEVQKDENLNGKIYQNSNNLLNNYNRKFNIEENFKNRENNLKMQNKILIRVLFFYFKFSKLN